MYNIGKAERITQSRIVQLFKNQLQYTYLGNWESEVRTSPIEQHPLLNFLIQTHSKNLANKAINKLIEASNGMANGLYQANKKVYNMLRYGVEVKEEQSKPKQTIRFINWDNIEANDFAFAEEVTVNGKHDKRPDIVIYLNGIAIGILELKRSSVSIEQGIRQNLDNQSKHFIPRFFTTAQIIMAGNDTQGLRYGTVGTPEKHYLKWKEPSTTEFDYQIDQHLYQLFTKERILELLRHYIIFDKGVKKLARPNQYFGIKAAQTNIKLHKGGIIWHTQGSGKSLTMVWLTKWIKSNIDDSRVLIITDRDELDKQIEALFIGVDENIYRTKSGIDLIAKLNSKEQSLICSLVHKFGRQNEEGDYTNYINDIKQNLPENFEAKGNIYVFVDECHRTQSGKLHEAMKTILPNALFIGFTGTPLLKKDKQKSIEVFGPYIGEPYKYDEAVEDGVVLDLLYEARDVEQFVTDQQSIDEWFNAETKGLTDAVKTQLKLRWGTMQKVLGSKARLEKIVFDIVKDFKIKDRLATGQGNAMLVSGSVYQACKYYELFRKAGFLKCAIITSYNPHQGDIKGEATGESAPTEALLKYETYQQMLNGKNVEEFENDAIDTFKKEPAQMQLLIVVDKLLTGFNAPSASYLYIDKSMQDHGLFQAICRVNRIDTDDKEYGYIIDYKDLFKSLENAIGTYTSGAFDTYDEGDVMGLLKDRFKASRQRLDNALEAVKALCEPVHPKDEVHYIRYFCGNTEDEDALKANEEKRITLYKAVVSLIRAYANVANEMHKVGYTNTEAIKIKEEVVYYTQVRDTIKQASGEVTDFKRFEPGMRQLMDMYLDAKSSRKLSDFENKSLIDLIANIADPQAEYQSKTRQNSVAEKIEGNIRKVINDQKRTNPRFYEDMSEILTALVKQRKEEALEYQKYMEKIKALAEQIQNPNKQGYPENLDSGAKRALYDNLDKNEAMALAVNSVIVTNKMDGWRNGGIKEKKLRLAIKALLNDDSKTDEILKIAKFQSEY